MRQRAVVYCLDGRHRVVATDELDFTSREDLADQLKRRLGRHALVEAWVESVCLLRLDAHRAAE